jgi:hypothetical protein
VLDVSTLLDSGTSNTNYVSKALVDQHRGALQGRIFPYKTKSTLADKSIKIAIEEYVLLAISIRDPRNDRLISIIQPCCVLDCAVPSIIGLPTLSKPRFASYLNYLLQTRHTKCISPADQELLLLYSNLDHHTLNILAVDIEDDPTLVELDGTTIFARVSAYHNSALHQTLAAAQDNTASVGSGQFRTSLITYY